MTLFPSSGVASNGKQIFSWSQAAAQLTRTGNTWSAISGTPATISYAFRSTAPSTMPDGISGFQKFNSAQIVAAEAALQLWSDVANITFVRVGSGTSGTAAYSNNATILFANYTTETDPASAFAYLPNPGGTGSSSFAGDVWVDNSEAENANPVFGEWGPHVLAHEIGHAIGINHPGDYDGGSPTYAADAEYWQDARMFTIMSYFGSTNAGGVIPTFSWGPQYHDIAAAQRLYGANMTTRTGDTTYGFNSTAGRTLFEINSASQGVVFSVWDAGGNDTLDLSGYSQNAEIDLRPGAFSSAGPTQSTGPAKYNISIAVGVVIENAVGGLGNDTIIGNDAANDLRGRTGRDSLTGSAGNDTLDGGAGDDTLLGGDNPDILVGGAGVDAIDGGADFDTADYSGSNAAVTVRLWQGTANGGHSEGDALTSIERVVGSAFNDRLVGADNPALGDALEGGAGNDTLIGLGGVDTLIGGAGNDSFDGGYGGDWFTPGAGVDTVDGGAGGVDFVSYAGSGAGVTVRLWQGTADGGDAQGDTFISIENAIGSSHNDRLVGIDNNKNILSGGAGNDTLIALGGDDTLIGGTGDDVMTGGTQDDTFVFRSSEGNDTITDFTAGAGAGDVIRLLNFGAGLDSFSDVLAATADDGMGNTVITVAGGTITLTGVLKAQLDADDFTFG